MTQDLHYIQRRILKDLLFSDKLKYSDIKPLNMEGSQFTFHLNKLVKEGLVVKDDNFYSLTPEGKGLTNAFDFDSTSPRRQAKHSVVFCAFREQKGELQTLVYTRKKNPFYNYQGYPTGKIMFGESVIEAAERELFEETGLSGNAKLIAIRHYRVYYPTNEDLVEDKVMYICKVFDPIGELNGNNEGEFLWSDVDNVKSVIKNPLPEFKEIFDLVSVDQGEVTFEEKNHYPEEF